MENVSQEQEHNIHEFFKKLIFDRDQKIQNLENELANGSKVRTIVDPIFEQKYGEAEEEIRSLRRQLAAAKAAPIAIAPTQYSDDTALNAAQKSLQKTQLDLKTAETALKSLQDNFSVSVEIEQRENQILRQKLIQLSEQATPTVVSKTDDTKLKALQSDYEYLKKDSTTQINNLKENQINLNENIMKMRNDYQTLRKQKGGFGFTSLMMCLALGAVAGFGIHWLFFNKKSDPTIVFQKFKDENLFNMEYDISQGRFDNIEATLKIKASAREYALIQPEIEFLKKIVGASKRRIADGKGVVASNTSEVNGFTVDPKVDESKIQEKAKKSLTISENAVTDVTIRSEASTGGDKLGKMKKGDVAGVWDRTNGLDKITINKDGNKYEVSDYWYKIETTDGLEGWVFGYFTNRSINRMTMVGTPAPTTPAGINTTAVPGATPGAGIPAAPVVKIPVPETPTSGNN
jgi:hypothetical protein